MIIICNREDDRKVQNRIDYLSKTAIETPDELKRKAFLERKSIIDNTIALIRVGGDNEDEIKEKTLRINAEFAEQRRKKLGTTVSEEQRKQEWNEAEEGLINQAVEIAGAENVILARDSKRFKSYVEKVQGMRFPMGYLSSYMITDSTTQVAHLNSNPYIILSNETISSIQDLLPILEQVINNDNNKSVLLIAPDYSHEVVDTLAVNMKRDTIRAVTVKAPSNFLQQNEFIADLSVLTGSSVITCEGEINWKNVQIEQLGKVDEAIITKTETTIVQGANRQQEIDSRLAQIKEQIIHAKSDQEKNELYHRYTKLSCGIAYILVGGNNEKDINERLHNIKTRISNTHVNTDSFLSMAEKQLVLDENRWYEEKKAQAEKEHQRHAQELAQKLSALDNEYTNLQFELANLKGIFSGNKRKQIERRLHEIKSELVLLKNKQ